MKNTYSVRLVLNWQEALVQVKSLSLQPTHSNWIYIQASHSVKEALIKHSNISLGSCTIAAGLHWPEDHRICTGESSPRYMHCSSIKCLFIRAFYLWLDVPPCYSSGWSQQLQSESSQNSTAGRHHSLLYAHAQYWTRNRVFDHPFEKSRFDALEPPRRCFSEGTYSVARSTDF